MKQFLFLIILPLPLAIFGQDCDCTSNFEWAKKTFEENDAGFQFAIDNKGKMAYEQHNTLFKEKISKIENADECAKIIYEWLTFFRSGHIAIRSIDKKPSQQKEKQRNEGVIDGFKDWERMDIDFPQFQDYLKGKIENDFEGIWVSAPYQFEGTLVYESYEIGIKKVGNEYIGFVIEADGANRTKGQIKLRIKKDLSATYYMQDLSVKDFESTILLGNNYLEMGFITLKRVFPEIDAEPQIERYFHAISVEDPYFEEINSKTVLLGIPRFWGSKKSKIDSIINANKDKILKTQNLIIDLRNNGGGSDFSFQGLLPILYTNPIRTVGVELLSTPLNNQRMLDFINKDEYGFDEDGKKWARETYNKLSKEIGEFVMLDEYPVTKTTFDTIHKYPENIGIIINENNGSTTEQFLLAAKQSKKVKLFGTTTAGVLDISNMYSAKSPCEEFELWYGLSKSMRIPEMTIDEKGIQPDYYIDKEIPKYGWIKYVSEILNE